MQSPRAFVESAPRLATLRMLGIGTSRSNWISLPIPAYLIHHPSAGSFLVDTGLHASVASKPAENLGRTIARFSRPEIEPGEDLLAQLRTRGLDPKAIPLVVMTHLHFDHSSGMSEFGDSTFVIGEDEWIAASTDSRPFLRGYRPSHYDYAFDYRTVSYDSDLISSYATFGRTFDLFGDGSVRLASTPGHSAGHQSVICRLRDRDLVIAGDAIYTIGQLDGAPEPPRPLDRHNWRRSMRELQHFARTYPQAVILPGHDPEHWKTVEKRYE
jgi:glyoxylase-like metal-dependent hydrolase (beta-lactamase superfamily II)